MAGVDLHPVKAGVLRPARALRELVNGQVDVGLFQYLDRGRLHPSHTGKFLQKEVLGEIALGCWGQGGRPERVAPARVTVAGDEAAVVQLHSDLASGGVHPVAQDLQPWHEAVV